MSSLARLIFIAVWVVNVQARNETLTHGWMPEPQGRGTWSILWSCLATIFICTWSALHLDVPKHHGVWYLLFRKLGWMLIASTAPEVVLFNTADNFFEARDLSNYLVKQGNPKWTLTQTQFVFAGGFWIRTLRDERSECYPDQLRTFIENGDLDGPSISEEELRARGKSDWVVKLIAILQIIWFGVQTLVRAIQHYQITALEIMTVAFVFCSVFIYGFSLYQPQDVEYPVILEMRNAALATDKTTSKQDSDKPNHAGEGAKPPVLSPRPGNMRSGLPSKYVPGWAAQVVPGILFGLFACAFGAIHCLAWNSPFPNSKERLAWRICSVTTTALPALVALLLPPALMIEGDRMEYLSTVSLALVAVLYIIGRATIIVLAFMTLRALPADAFQTVNWSIYLPHFAA